jgi:hypothetical protein
MQQVAYAGMATVDDAVAGRGALPVSAVRAAKGAFRIY